VITDVFPAHQASFEEAQSMIRPALVRDKAMKLTSQKADELAAKVKAMNGDLKKAAQSMGLEVVTTPEFARHGSIQGLGSPDAFQEIFTKPAGTVFGPSLYSTSKVIGKITARIAPNMADLPAQTLITGTDAETFLPLAGTAEGLRVIDGELRPDTRFPLPESAVTPVPGTP